MKKILYITTISSTINAFLVPHIKYLINNGYKVDCAASKNISLNEELIKLGVNLFDIPFSRNPFGLNNVMAYKELIKIQSIYKYDLIHVHTPIAALYGRMLKLKYPRLKTVYTVHGFHFYEGAPKKNKMIFYPIEKIMSKFTDAIITMNDEDYKSAQKFNIKKVYRINGVGLDLNKYKPLLLNSTEIRRSLDLKDDDFVILMIAEVNKNKNHIQLINSVEILKNKGINIKVLCAGIGPLIDEINAEIENRNLQDTIKMLGFRKDIPQLIQICDLGILLSYREGLPRNIMELMAYGKAIIGTDIRGIRDLIDNGLNGYLVEVNNEIDTAKKIELLYKNRDILNRMSSVCYEKVKKYNVDQITYEILQIVNEVIV